MCSGYVVGESHTAAMEDGAEDHETLGPVIDIGISVVQLHHRFWTRTGTLSGSRMGRGQARRGIDDGPGGGSAKS
jgi:hypothetical protein